jgi:hypothetical protein
MPSKASLENRKKIYQSLCYVLSDRASQVAWDEYTPADWDLFAQMADHEGVAPLMYWKLKDSPVQVPPSTFNLLRSTYYQTLAQNTLMYQELERILKALDEARIEAIVLKGAALAATVYEDIGLRPMGDLDLLVKREQIEASVNILESMGYFTPHRHVTDLLDWNLTHHINLQEVESNKVSIELHWNLISGDADWRTPPIDWFWEQAGRIVFPVEQRSLEESFLRDRISHVLTADPIRSMITFSPTAHLLYLSAHAMLHHGGSEARLLWFYDLHLIVSNPEYDLDWNAMVERALEYQWTPALLAGLNRSKTLFGSIIPEGTYASLLEAESLSPQARQLVQRKDSEKATLAMNDFGRMLSLEKWERVRFAIAIVLPSRAYIHWRYNPKPTWIWPLCYLYRWFRMLREAIKTLKI